VVFLTLTSIKNDNGGGVDKNDPNLHDQLLFDKKTLPRQEKSKGEVKEDDEMGVDKSTSVTSITSSSSLEEKVSNSSLEEQVTNQQSGASGINAITEVDPVVLSLPLVDKHTIQQQTRKQSLESNLDTQSLIKQQVDEDEAEQTRKKENTGKNSLKDGKDMKENRRSSTKETENDPEIKREKDDNLKLSTTISNQQPQADLSTSSQISLSITPSSSTATITTILPQKQQQLTTATFSGPPLPTRLVEYFGVMVSSPINIENGNSDENNNGDLASSSALNTTPTPYLHPLDDKENDDYDDTSDAEEYEEGKRTRREGRGAPSPRQSFLQFRRPKVDHNDFHLPENLEWFIFPDGIKPIRKRRATTTSAIRPKTSSSVFVLTDEGGRKVYGVCLTAFRRESPAVSVAENVEEDEWWPVALFMVTRLPIIPQLLRVLTRIYEIYDGGSSSNDAGSDDANAFRPKSYCSLDEYLKMLIFETPVPIRDLRLSVTIVLPSENEPTLHHNDRYQNASLPSSSSSSSLSSLSSSFDNSSSTCTFFLPPHDELPLLQFDIEKGVLRSLPPASLFKFVIAAALCKPIVIIAKTEQELTELCESVLALIYPLQWEFGYIPILPSHMGDLLQSPSPLLAGILSSYACRLFEDLGAEELTHLVVVDATTGHVDVGVEHYLARRRLLHLERQVRRSNVTDSINSDEVLKATKDIDTLRNSLEERINSTSLHTQSSSSFDHHDDDGISGIHNYPSSSTVQIERELRIPSTYLEPFMKELSVLHSNAKKMELENLSASSNDAHLIRAKNAPLQNLLLRFFSHLLLGYRRSTFFPGVSPQYTPLLSSSAFISFKTIDLKAPQSAAPFFSALCSSQSMSRLLQRHTRRSLFAFHTYSALLQYQQQQANIIGEMVKSEEEMYLTRCALKREIASFNLIIPPPRVKTLISNWTSPPLDATRFVQNGNESVNPSVKSSSSSSSSTVSRSKKTSSDHTLRIWRADEVSSALGLDVSITSELSRLASESSRRDINEDDDDDDDDDIERKEIDEYSVGQVNKGESNLTAISKASLLQDRINLWLSNCLLGQTSSSSSSMSSKELIDDIERILLSSSLACRIFIKTLQNQLIVSTGLFRPLSNRNLKGVVNDDQNSSLKKNQTTASSKVPTVATSNNTSLLQPYLGLGVVSFSILGKHVSSTLNEIEDEDARLQYLVQLLIKMEIPKERFEKLVRACLSLLEECREEKDVCTAGACLQISLYISSTRQEKENSKATNKTTSSSSSSTLSTRPRRLIDALASDTYFKKSSFWESLATIVNDGNLNQFRQISTSLSSSSSSSSTSKGADDSSQLSSSLLYIFAKSHSTTPEAISAVVASFFTIMRICGSSTSDLQAFASRVCVKSNLSADEERKLIALAAAESSPSMSIADVSAPLLRSSSSQSSTSLSTSTSISTTTSTTSSSVASASTTKTTIVDQDKIANLLNPNTSSSSSSSLSSSTSSVVAAATTTVVKNNDKSKEEEVKTRTLQVPISSVNVKNEKAVIQDSRLPVLAVASQEDPALASISSTTPMKKTKVEEEKKDDKPGSASTTVIAEQILPISSFSSSSLSPSSTTKLAQSSSITPELAAIQPPTTALQASVADPRKGASTANILPSTPPPLPPRHEKEQQEHIDEQRQEWVPPWMNSDLSVQEAEELASAYVTTRRVPPSPLSATSSSSSSETLSSSTSSSSTTANFTPVKVKPSFASTFSATKKPANTLSKLPVSNPTVEQTNVSCDVANMFESDYSLPDSSSSSSTSLFESFFAEELSQSNLSSASLKCTSHHSCFATGASISSIYFDASDGRIAAGGNDGRVALFDGNTASLLHVFSDHSSAVTAVRITGNMLASVSDGGTLRLSSFDSLVKDTSRGEEGSFLSKTTEVVANTAGTPAPQKRSFFGGSSRSFSAAAAAAINNSATVDASSSSSSQSHNETGSSTISSVQIYHPYNAYAAVSKITNSKPLISVDAWTKPSEIPSTEGGGGGQGQVSGGINKSRWFSSGGSSTQSFQQQKSSHVVVTGSADGVVRAYSVQWTPSSRANGVPSASTIELSSHRGLHKAGSSVDSINLSIDGRLAVSSGRDGHVGVVDIVAGKEWILKADVSERFKQPPTGGGGRSKEVSNNNSTSVLATAHFPQVFASIDVVNRPIFVTSGGIDGAVRIWDLRRSALAFAFRTDSPVWCSTTISAHGYGNANIDADGVIVSPRAPLGDVFLFSGHEDGYIRQWDSRRPDTPLSVIDASASTHEAVTCLSAHGNLLMSGSSDGTFGIWNTFTGKGLRRRNSSAAPRRPISGVALAGQYAVTTSWDGSVRFYSTSTTTS